MRAATLYLGIVSSVAMQHEESNVVPMSYTMQIHGPGDSAATC